MKFAKRGDRNRQQQDFDKEKIFVERCGQKINCFDAIQAANVDTNIYDVMRKYHCQQDEAVQLMQARGGEQGIYADVIELQRRIQDIGDVQQVMQRATMLFEQLPAEVKQKYGNDAITFYKSQDQIFKDLKQLDEQTKPDNNKAGDTDEIK